VFDSPQHYTGWVKFSGVLMGYPVSSGFEGRWDTQGRVHQPVRTSAVATAAWPSIVVHFDRLARRTPAIPRTRMCGSPGRSVDRLPSSRRPRPDGPQRADLRSDRPGSGPNLRCDSISSAFG